MLFTWDSTNLCIIFKSWHVRGTASLVFSLLAIVAVCVGYEALREATRRYETWANKRQETAPREFSFHFLPNLLTHYPFISFDFSIYASVFENKKVAKMAINFAVTIKSSTAATLTKKKNKLLRIRRSCGQASTRSRRASGRI